jgi:hypothetical protein
MWRNILSVFQFILSHDTTEGGSCSSLLGTAGNVCDSSCGCQTGQLMFLIFKCDEYWENIYFRWRQFSTVRYIVKSLLIVGL